MEQVLCKYFQCGFCKFGNMCRKQHIKEICPIQNCISQTCLKRHPKVCKYFLTQNSCKFGERCSYKDEVHSNQNEILELKEKIAVLEGSFELLDAKLSELTKELALSTSKGSKYTNTQTHKHTYRKHRPRGPML